jgi:hypothetical protein
MPEILTESFCERCGTRYTFESAAPKVRRIGRIRTLSKGLRNFVMSDGTSLDEALAAARSETEREAVSQQLDAFHKAFNFCMSCRQYTCSNCWNGTEARCLTCAPQAMPEGATLGALEMSTDAAGNGAAPVAADPPWPGLELRPTESGDGADGWPTGSTPAEGEWAEAELDSAEIANRLAALGVGADEPETPEAAAGEAQEEPEPAVVLEAEADGDAPAEPAFAEAATEAEAPSYSAYAVEPEPQEPQEPGTVDAKAALFPAEPVPA